MNILPQRYISIRNRLIELFNILEYRVYPFWIAPEFMMTTDQLRDRYEYVKDGYANDTQYYSQPELRNMEVVKLFKYLENFRDHTNLGYGQANTTVVEIYESIQEYLSLWCELIRANVWQHPPMSELRNLESIAYLAFPHYRQIKPYRRNQVLNERYKQDQMLQSNGLAGFAALFGMYRLGNSREEEISFVSHLDSLNTSNDVLPASTGPTFLSSHIASVDSLSRVEPTGGDPNWVFTV